MKREETYSNGKDHRQKEEKKEQEACYGSTELADLSLTLSVTLSVPFCIPKRVTGI